MQIGNKSAIALSVLLTAATAGSAAGAFAATATVSKIAYAALSVTSACATYASIKANQKIRQLQEKNQNVTLSEYLKLAGKHLFSIPSSLYGKVTSLYTPGEAQVRV